jgi:hypothetical protein
VDPDPDSMGSLDPDSNPGGQKTKENCKKVKFHFLKGWMFSFEV